jgi:hypothetical protein
LVLDNDFRHPLVLAKEIATLDLATEGRVEVGLGAGWMKSDYAATGIPYDPAGTRVERLTKSLQIIKSLWSNGTATFEGQHYRVTRAEGAPRPPLNAAPARRDWRRQPPNPGFGGTGGGRRNIYRNLASGEVNAEVARSSLAGPFA